MPGTDSPGAPTRSPTEAVVLEIPPGGDLLSLARLTAATMAARCDFSVEEVEDLRLAVDELCLPLVRGSARSRLRLQFARDGQTVTITCTPIPHADGGDGSIGGDSIGDSSARGDAGDNGDAPHPDDALSGYILDALVDEHGPVDEGRQLAGHWLRKRRTS